MPREPTNLDEIERAILYHLQTDARNTTNAELSDVVGVSATTIGQRIDDLEERGIIKAYHATVNYERSGFPHRILCTVHPEDRHELAEDLIGKHGVISVRELISGEENLQVEIVGRTREEVVETITAVEKAGAEVVDTELIKQEWRQPFDDFVPE